MIPSDADLNPRRRFVDNPVIMQLRNNKAFNQYISSSKLSWVNNSHIPRLLYNKMISWDVYNEYMAMASESYTADKKFVMKLVSNTVFGIGGSTVES